MFLLFINKIDKIVKLDTVILLIILIFINLIYLRTKKFNKRFSFCYNGFKRIPY
jgi:hypothetical protein